MLGKVAMEARVSPELAAGRDRGATEGVTTAVALGDFSEKLGDFCDAIVEGLEGVNGKASRYALDAVEMHVELTSRGEVRLIAAAGADVKGAIKLMFRAKQEGTQRAAALQGAR